MAKYMVAYWRSPSYNMTRICMTTIIALLYGTFFLNKAHIPKEGQLLTTSLVLTVSFTKQGATSAGEV